MLALVVFALLVVGLLWLPLLLVRLAFKALFAVVLLPFKLVGLVLRILFGAVGLAFRVVFSGMALVAGVLAFVAFVVVLPLLPLVLIGLGLWLVLRESRSSRRALNVA